MNDITYNYNELKKLAEEEKLEEHYFSMENPLLPLLKSQSGPLYHINRKSFDIQVDVSKIIIVERIDNSIQITTTTNKPLVLPFSDLQSAIHFRNFLLAAKNKWFNKTKVLLSQDSYVNQKLDEIHTDLLHKVDTRMADAVSKINALVDTLDSSITRNETKTEKVLTELSNSVEANLKQNVENQEELTNKTIKTQLQAVEKSTKTLADLVNQLNDFMTKDINVEWEDD